MKGLFRHLHRRRWTLVALAAALGGLLAYLLWPGPGLRAGSELLTEGDVSVGSRRIESYSAVYRVEDHAADGSLTVSTELVTVRLPFQGRTTVLSGPPPGDQEVSIGSYDLGRFGVQGEVLVVAPGPPVADRRAGSLPELAEAGYAEQRELRRVAQRPCRVYRTAEGFAVASLTPVAAAGESYTDTCVDEAGLVLEEAAFTEGRMWHRRLAVEVVENPQIDPEELEVPEPTLPVEQGGSLRLLDPASRLPGGDFWEVSGAPEGFEVVGRYAVVPAGQPGLGDPTGQGRLEAFVSEVWTDGIDLLVVEQGASRGGPPFEEDPNARRVEAGELGSGELRYGLVQSELRVRLAGSRFVRVRATAGPSRLVELARSLVAVEGGDLVLDPGMGPRLPVASNVQ